MSRSYAHVYGAGTGMRGLSRYAVRRVWHVTLTLSDGSQITEEVECVFAAGAIIEVKRKLPRGVVVVREEAVSL